MAKKSFKDNPALHFITPPAPARPTTSGAETKKTATPTETPLKPNPLYVETKSKRVQLLMQPGLHARLKTLADDQGQSLNNLIHMILSEWLERCL